MMSWPWGSKKGRATATTEDSGEGSISGSRPVGHGRVYAREASADERGLHKLSGARESGQEYFNQGKEAGKEKVGTIKGKVQENWGNKRDEAHDSAQAARKEIENAMENKEPPPAFLEMGKPAKDLLTKGFVAGASVAFTSAPLDNVLMTTTGTQSDDLITGLVTTVAQIPPYSFQLATGSTGIIIGTLTADNLLNRGLRGSVETAYPGAKDSFKAKLSYSQPLMTAHVGVEKFARQPVLESAFVFGTKEVSGGLRARYSIQADSLNLEVGMQLALPGAVTVTGKVDLLDQKNSALYILQEPNPKMQVGLEISDPWNAAGKANEGHRLAAVVKGQLDDRTSVKARVTKDARIGLQLEHQVGPSSATFYMDLNSKDLNSTPKTGISISLMNLN